MDGVFLFLFAWLPLCILVAAIGAKRNIGGFMAFILSFIFSPLIGLLVVALSKRKDEATYQKEMLETQKAQQEAIAKITTPPPAEAQKNISIADELAKLNVLRTDKVISEEEYVKLKEKLIGI